jgi:protein TonB
MATTPPLAVRTRWRTSAPAAAGHGRGLVRSIAAHCLAVAVILFAQTMMPPGDPGSPSTMEIVLIAAPGGAVAETALGGAVPIEETGPDTGSVEASPSEPLAQAAAEPAQAAAAVPEPAPPAPTLPPIERVAAQPADPVPPDLVLAAYQPPLEPAAVTSPEPSAEPPQAEPPQAEPPQAEPPQAEPAPAEPAPAEVALAEPSLVEPPSADPPRAIARDAPPPAPEEIVRPSPPPPPQPARVPPPPPKPEPVRVASRTAEQTAAPRPRAASPSAGEPSATVAQAAPGPASPPATATEALPPARPRIDPGWNTAIAAWLHRHKTYPAAARSRGEEGSTQVRFTVARDGRVLAVDLTRGSGSTILDDAVRRLLTGAILPAFPRDMPHETVTVTVQISYRLER